WGRRGGRERGGPPAHRPTAGGRPAATGGGGVGTMSGHADGGARRRQVLEVIYRSPAPLGASEIAGQVGVHPNTARFHLAALMAEGGIERMVEEPCGPGRPRVVYRARPGMARGGARRRPDRARR